MKINDSKAIEVTVTKWGYAYSTSDNHIPEVADKQQEIKDKYDKKADGNPGQFLTGAKKASFKVVFSQKMLAKLPVEYRDAGYRYPTYVVLKDVYYNVIDRVIFINFFTEAKLK